MPQVPGLAEGTLEGTATIEGVVESVRTSAVGTLAGTGTITGSSTAKANAVGTVSGSTTTSAKTTVKLNGTLTGTASMTGYVRPRLAGSVAGSASITGYARPRLTGTLTGNATISGAASAVASASGTIAGTASITGTAALAKLPAGMDKVGTQALPAVSSVTFANATKVTSWTSRSGFPQTVITNDSLVSSAPMTVSYSAKVTFSSGGVGSLVQFWVVRNDTEIVANGNTGATLTGTVTLNANDTLSLWAAGHSGVTSGYRTVTAGVNTFISWTVVS
ncbi:hypothetical protein A6I85_05980 [Prescottella equi]|nr:hypothetical protein A6I85_05980 [Prescottella equi]